MPSKKTFPSKVAKKPHSKTLRAFGIMARLHGQGWVNAIDMSMEMRLTPRQIRHDITSLQQAGIPIKLDYPYARLDLPGGLEFPRPDATMHRVELDREERDALLTLCFAFTLQGDHLAGAPGLLQSLRGAWDKLAEAYGEPGETCPVSFSAHERDVLLTFIFALCAYADTLASWPPFPHALTAADKLACAKREPVTTTTTTTQAKAA